MRWYSPLPSWSNHRATTNALPSIGRKRTGWTKGRYIRKVSRGVQTSHVRPDGRIQGQAKQKSAAFARLSLGL